MTPSAPTGVEALRERIDALVGSWDGVEAVTMFGCPSFTAHGELFCVVSAQGLSLTRLPPGERDSLSDLTAVAPFDAGGRVVEGWATVAPPDLPDDTTLAPFVRASYEAAIRETTGAGSGDVSP